MLKNERNQKCPFCNTPIDVHCQTYDYYLDDMIRFNTSIEIYKDYNLQTLTTTNYNIIMPEYLAYSRTELSQALNDPETDWHCHTRNNFHYNITINNQHYPTPSDSPKTVANTNPTAE